MSGKLEFVQCGFVEPANLGPWTGWRGLAYRSSKLELPTADLYTIEVPQLDRRTTTQGARQAVVDMAVVSGAAMASCRNQGEHVGLVLPLTAGELSTMDKTTRINHFLTRAGVEMRVEDTVRGKTTTVPKRWKEALLQFLGHKVLTNPQIIDALDACCIAAIGARNANFYFPNGITPDRV